MPLGVFALVMPGEEESNMVIQLAVSKDGVIAGNYHNEDTDSNRPLEGHVDRETQRAAWKFADGKNAEIVFDTVIYNLTKDDSDMLVHFGKEKTQVVNLVRMPVPEEDAASQ